MNITHCFVASGSGGHIIPALTQAKLMLNHNPDMKVLFFTTNAKVDQQILQESKEDHIKFVTLSCVKAPTSLFKLPFFIMQFISSWIKTCLHLIKYKPSSITSTGGFLAIPVSLAGYVLGIPVHLFELNVQPGKAIVFLSGIAQQIFICFEETKKYLPPTKCVLVDYPLRPELREEYHNSIEPLQYKKTILVLGGSQGSLFLNQLVIKWAQQLNAQQKSSLFILHQVGNNALDQYQQLYQELGIAAHIFSFDPSVGKLYKQASLIICRSGAGTLFEIVHFQKNCITIPLITKSTNHQAHNAYALARLYPFVHVMHQKGIEENPHAFFQQVTNWLAEANQ